MKVDNSATASAFKRRSAVLEFLIKNAQNILRYTLNKFIILTITSNSGQEEQGIVLKLESDTLK